MQGGQSEAPMTSLIAPCMSTKESNAKEEEPASKRQRIEHLEQREWVLTRPETYIGAMEPAEISIPDFSGEQVTFKTIIICPALLSLSKELFDNALDNCQRDNTQRFIKVEWKADHLIVSNDGSTLPVEKDPKTNEWAICLAFGKFQSGSNFDVKETGKKETVFTSGRNGVGSKGCNVFAKKFAVRVTNCEDKKTFSVVWEDNMSVMHPPKIVSSTRKSNDTTIEWHPDVARLGGDLLFMENICKWFSYNASLCAPPAVKVYFNGEWIKMRSPEHFCKAFGGVAPIASETIEKEGKVMMHLCVAARDPEATVNSTAGLTYAFVNGTPCSEGSHSKYILSKIGDIVEAKAKSKRTGNKDLHITPSFLQSNAITIAILLVEKERFTDQRKRCLDAPVKDWGWKWEPSDSFRATLERSTLPDRLIVVAKEKADAEAAKATKTSTRHPNIAKYEPALRRNTDTATLIVCEGDSAGNLVRSGLTVVGRKDYGLYPLRGKFINARGLSTKAILENKEALELLKILGIQLNTKYDKASIKRLPYAKLMVMTDQDVDGSHIMGLLFNLIDTCAPSLLEHKKDYLCRFATSLIRVAIGKKEVGFYSQSEYDTWCDQRKANGEGIGVAKYFKGLGTSSAEQAKQYFRNLNENTITMLHDGSESSESLDLAFNKKRADDRRAFLSDHCDPLSYVDYSQSVTTVQDFVYNELLPQYALASLKRAIPSLDGFKEALRKVFFGARSLKLSADISVANAAGKIASHTNYHHRGTAMEDTIIGMAADYAGTANINLLLPHGQFGTRHKHAAASAAYPKICLNAPMHELLFPPVDDMVLSYVVDEGKTVEPTMYAPVIALPLVIGCKGIATGWCTDIPMFHPLDVLDATLDLLDGVSQTAATPMKPWYRGFAGVIEAIDETNFVVYGTGFWKGDDFHVTEIPPFRETESYKEDWTKADIASGGIIPGEGHTDDRIHLILKGCKRLNDPIEELGLKKKVSLGNMHLLDPTGKIKKYNTPVAIIKEHLSCRMEVYDKRLAFLVSQCKCELSIVKNKARFIQECLAGNFDMRQFQNDDEAGAACVALGLDPSPDEDNGKYGYLINMQMRSLTQQRADRLIAEAKKKETELQELYQKTSRKLWKDDLQKLKEAILADRRYERCQ